VTISYNLKFLGATGLIVYANAVPMFFIIKYYKLLHYVERSNNRGKWTTLIKDTTG